MNMPIEPVTNAAPVHPSPTVQCPVPVEERCCCVTLYRAMENNREIRCISYDTAEATLEVTHSPGEHLDPHKLEDVLHSLRERRAACRDREQHSLRRGCGYCVQQLKRSQMEHHEPVTCDSAECTALRLLSDESVTFRSGVMTVHRREADGSFPAATGRHHLPTQRFSIEEDARALQTDAPEQQHPLGRFFNEPVMVGVTGVAMVAGAVLERVIGLDRGSTLAMYLLAYSCGGYFGLRAGVTSIRQGRIDIDLLMILAAVGAVAVGAPFEGALLLFLFSLSNVLQAYALDRTRSAIRALTRLRPDSAVVLQSADDPAGRRMPVEDITVDALVLVRPGDRIPLDGVVVAGASSVDQATITGESMPVDRAPGDDVLAGTINQNGRLVVQVRRSSGESTIARVITLVEEARENQAKTERFLDRFEQYYAVGVIGVTVLAGILPVYLLGWSWGESLYKAITLMVAASPCALIISTPASILSSIGNGARRGILFKGGVHVEQAAKLQVVAFDKTGTLTEGKPHVSDIISLSEETEEEILRIAAALEAGSRHVIAAAIGEEAQRRRLDTPQVESFASQSGSGVTGMIGQREFRITNPRGISREETRDRLAATVDALESEGKTVVLLHEEGRGVLGVIAVRDRIRQEAHEVVQRLRKEGIQRVVMLTGDNWRAARAIGEQAGVDEVFAELMPEDKLETIRRIEETWGAAAMVGDGVNDAPALAGARLGIAMGAAGTDVALETADVVLLSDDLEKLPYLVALSRQTRRTLVTNLAVAMGLIVMMVVGIYTIDLPLPLAVVGHEGGTVLVSLNGLRLLMFRQSRKR